MFRDHPVKPDDDGVYWIHTPPHPEVRALASLEGSDITPADIEQGMAEKAREFNEKGGEIYLAEERPAKPAD